jgi:hypothetical protein
MFRPASWPEYSACPVLHASPLAEHGVEIACNVACGVDIRVRRLQELVHDNAVLDREAGLTGEIRVGDDTDAHADEVVERGGRS